MERMSLVGWAIYVAASIAGFIFFVLPADGDFGTVVAYSVVTVIGWHVMAAIFRSEEAKLDDEYYRMRRQRDERLLKSDPEAYTAEAERRSLNLTYGPIKPEVICPHCSVKGHVRSKAGVAIDRSSETGVGALIGQKRVIERKVQNAHCENCKMTWQV